ncbi:MAG TPA: hypothetical protein VNS19_18285 [Acidimicrobiales bacterium]|nr:hypothetical protein [Acidimicrobiales bacterium]
MTDPSLLAAVVASDRHYFELGARTEPLPGGVLLHLPGSAGVGAGTVVWVDEPNVVAKADDWVDAAATAAREAGRRCCGCTGSTRPDRRRTAAGWAA